MTLQTEAQLVVVDPSVMMPQDGGDMLNRLREVPLEVSEMDHHPSAPDEGGPAHADMMPASEMEVHDKPVEIVIESVPGAGDPGPLEVHDMAPAADEVAPPVDDNEAKKPKKDPRWDWESRGAKGFVAWIKERCDDVPRHSGNDTAGLERAMAYLDKLDGEISRAMRMDLDGELDANQIEKVRSIIDDGVSRLESRLDQVKQHKKQSKKKKKTSAVEVMDGALVKEAQKITGVQGVFVTVDILTARIAKTCINGMVSAGHDIEDLFRKQSEYYNLNRREKACVMQLLEDMGYAFRQDRLLDPDDGLHVELSDNGDFAANYADGNTDTWGNR